MEGLPAPLRALIPVNTPLPFVAPIRQRVSTGAIDDVERAVREAFASIGASDRLRAGSRVAITAGSRGIDRIDTLLRAVVSEVKGCGANPVIVAAMGSHGGGTGEGQRDVLRGYGITEATTDCPIHSEMDVVALGRSESGCEVFCDQFASESDAVIVVGRVKPHSILVGDIGSGLCKMAAIGLGKARGANAIHVHGVEAHLESAARTVLAKVPIAFGVAVVENAQDRLAVIEAVAPEQFIDADRRLLKIARASLPTIPFDPIDVLIVDQIGKNVSGAGMDPNVVGMWRRNGGPPDRTIRRIVALDLTAESHGNAVGIGMADITTRKLVDKIDYVATYANALTSDFLSGIKVPIALPSERDAIALACKPFDPRTIRLVRIADTAHLETMYVSEALVREISGNLEVVGPLDELALMPG